MIVKKKRNDVHKINLHLECVADIIKAFLDMKSLRTFHSQVVFRRKLLVYVSSKRRPGTSLAVDWKKPPSGVGNAVSIPGWETKIQHSRGN